MDYRRSRRTKNGKLFFYDTGGDIVEDLGALRIPESAYRPRSFGDEYE